MTLTSNDLQAIGKILDKKLVSFATKKDLTPLATKKDLTPFATKQDLAPFATKQDLLAFATKEDVKNMIASNNRIFGTILRVELAVTAKEIIKAVKVGFHEVVSHVADHEKRIERLEEHTGLAKN